MIFLSKLKQDSCIVSNLKFLNIIYLDHFNYNNKFIAGIRIDFIIGKYFLI